MPAYTRGFLKVLLDETSMCLFNWANTIECAQAVGWMCWLKENLVFMELY